ncbi:CpcD/allophycocyanin linker domain-containing protein [Synechococcus sp. RSCCF101]|uniref:phycobilisome linker polypeptide n=1 Tax=Synechococcus sp. RSCCF101 TaxID=2511069 RepID=UPI001245D8FF|nr:phycobilisome linker polypeptide [Synechococcus sp. RSCCF101]QEY32129.1 CpcD/allophycocyanin linker domain-containing protein [Synechococcus sp. RSCCF101]
MKVSAGNRSTTDTGDRQVSLLVTGIANNDYLRSADTTLKVSYSRMNETMRMVQRMGGRITAVTVCGGDLGHPQTEHESHKAESSDD